MSDSHNSKLGRYSSTRSVLDRSAASPGRKPCPAPAAAAGFLMNTFSTERFTTANFDAGFTRASGYQWYFWNWFTSQPNVTRTTINDDGSISFAGNAGSAKICSVVKRPGGEHRGTTFGGGGYFKAIISLDPNDIDASKSIPAWWMLDYNSMRNASQWAGRASGYTHFLEWDLFEWYKNEPNKYRATLHDTYGIYGITCPRGFCRSTAETVVNFPSNMDWRVPHAIGGLWRPAALNQAGSLTHWFDRIQVGETFRYEPYSGSENPPIHSETTWRFGVVDSSKMALIFGSGCKMTVHAVNIWQSNNHNNLVM